MDDYQSQDWYKQYKALVEGNRLYPLEKDHAICVRLAPQLCKAAITRVEWTPSYLLHVLRPTEKSKVGVPSPVFKMAVAKLSTPTRVRKDRPRLYTPFETKNEIEFIASKLPAHRRREILLAAAERE